MRKSLLFIPIWFGRARSRERQLRDPGCNVWGGTIPRIPLLCLPDPGIDCLLKYSLKCLAELILIPALCDSKFSEPTAESFYLASKGYWNLRNGQIRGTQKRSWKIAAGPEWCYIIMVPVASPAFSLILKKLLSRLSVVAILFSWFSWVCDVIIFPPWPKHYLVECLLISHWLGILKFKFVLLLTYLLSCADQRVWPEQYLLIWICTISCGPV